MSKTSSEMVGLLVVCCRNYILIWKIKLDTGNWHRLFAKVGMTVDGLHPIEPLHEVLSSFCFLQVLDMEIVGFAWSENFSLFNWKWKFMAFNKCQRPKIKDESWKWRKCLLKPTYCSWPSWTLLIFSVANTGVFELCTRVLNKSIKYSGWKWSRSERSWSNPRASRFPVQL